MPRVSFEQAFEALNNGFQDSVFFTLKNNNDSKKVQFPFSTLSELEVLTAHKLECISTTGKKYTKWVSCSRLPEEPLANCPLCNAGYQPKQPIFIPLVDYETGKVYFWEGKKAIVNELKTIIERTPNFRNMVFEIIRIGAKGDINTTYKLYPQAQLAPKDFSQVKIPPVEETVLQKLTPQDVTNYLQTGMLPSSNPSNNASGGNVQQNVSQQTIQQPQSRASFQQPTPQNAW